MDLNEGNVSMTLIMTTTLKTCIAAVCLTAFAGCTDLKPMEAQIEDLKSQVSKLQGQTAKALSDAVAAKTQAAAANSSAAGAQSTANQALSAAQSNSAGVEAINNKIDQMFHRTLSK
jgi:outer membrane murein-binding lipoprotein Lpp